jgi:isocitrate/isopropylmalate dehydrogenase
MFEPIHGSAPDIAGKGIANPIGTIWSGALLLEHLGEKEAAGVVVQAIEKTIQDGVLTVDLGGTAKTVDVGNHVKQIVGAGFKPAHTTSL